MGRYAAVLFDLDGTLCRHEQAIEPVFRGAFEDLGVEPVGEPADLWVAMREITEFDGETEQLADGIARVAADRGRPLDARAWAEAFVARLDWTDVTFLPGAERALAAARANGPVGLLTNGPEPRQSTKLAALGLDGAFDPVVYAGELDRRKPHREPFDRAVAALGVSPSASSTWETRWNTMSTARSMPASRSRGSMPTATAPATAGRPTRFGRSTNWLPCSGRECRERRAHTSTVPPGDMNAADAVAEALPDRSVRRVDPVQRGNHKRTYLVTLDDGEVVVQLSTRPAAFRTELALARAVRERTSVPTPAILAEESYEGGRYAVVERASGDDLHERFAGLPLPIRETVARSFGRWLAACHEAFRFDGYGDVALTDGELRATDADWRAWFGEHLDAGLAALPPSLSDLREPVETALADADLPNDRRRGSTRGIFGPETPSTTTTTE
ncbi:HAD family hydrolase [Halosegnis longus]|uniref:HAD family hydrolase n=1 Tax=Halosegnis longus TaxID=2216012 RepID=UPI0018F53E61